ncbi:MAG: hypothetical protein LBO74_00320 [Candidatus Symbiothrix sp.]|nr:hypothetical protein [Candidatus Symbiothrix sp.]
MEKPKKNSNFAKNNRENVNNGIFNGSTQKELGGSNEVSIRTEIADKLRNGVEEARRKLAESSQNGSRILSQYEQEDLEKQITFDYAKENGLWVDDLYSLGRPLKGGIENTLALDNMTGILYKSNNLLNSKFLISNLIEQIRVHNLLFSETKYEIVGFTGIDNGKNRTPHIEVILKQDYVPNTTESTPQEILDYMQSIGFQQLNEITFTNGQYIVSDLRPRNVLKDENGIIYVVDDIVSDASAEPLYLRNS